MREARLASLGSRRSSAVSGGQGLAGALVLHLLSRGQRDACVALRRSELSRICDINYVGVETDGLSRSAVKQIFPRRPRPDLTCVNRAGGCLWKTTRDERAAASAVSIANSSSYLSLFVVDSLQLELILEF